MALSDSPMAKMMYRNALMNLSNGVVDAIDKDILSSTPLPDNFIASYLSEETDALTVMKLGFNSLSTWIEEAKKASYFSKHFVTLSRMIMSGVAAMARGLVTLHARGEDLNQAPMSIQDLIGVGSYHIRKSYLGVLQTSRKNPEIGERLLINQLSWTNTMLRLFKTKEKLESESSMCKVQSSNEKIEAAVTPELPVGNDVKAFEAFEDSGESLSPLGAISAPSAYSAPRAFGTFGKRYETSKKAHGMKRKQLPGTGDQGLSNEEGRIKNEVNSEISDSDIQEQGTRKQDSGARGQENEEGRMKNEVNSESSDFGVQEQRTRGQDSGARGQENEEGKMKNEVNSESSDFRVQEQGTRGQNSGARGKENEEGRMKNEANSESPDFGVQDQGKRDKNGSSDKDNSSSFIHNSSLEDNSSLSPPVFPEYYDILLRTFERSDGSDNGVITFTKDEARLLLADPQFCSEEPELAEDIRNALST